MPFTPPPQQPNFTPGANARITLDRYDFEAHLEGTNPPYATNFRHHADQIDVVPLVTIGSSQPTTVQSAIAALAAFVSPPTVAPATTTSLGIIQLAGDLAGIATNVQVSGLRSRPISNVAPSTGNVLTWNGSSWTPTAPGNAPTFAGDLSGTQISQTVVGIQGRPVSSAAPTTNQVLLWNGSTWLPGTFSGGTPSGPAGGDLSGSYPNPVVASISSSVTVPITPANLQFTAVTTSPTISHAQQANNAFPSDLNVTPQAPGASPLGSSFGTPGNFNVNLAAPTGGGNEAKFRIRRQGTAFLTIGYSPSIPFSLGAGMQVQTTGLVPMQINSSGQPLLLDTGGSNSMLLRSNGFSYYLGSSTLTAVLNSNVFGIAGNTQIGSTTGDSAGGGGVLGITNTSTPPGSNPNSGVVVYASGGSLFYRDPTGARGNFVPQGIGATDNHLRTSNEYQFVGTIVGAAATFIANIPVLDSSMLSLDVTAQLREVIGGTLSPVGTSVASRSLTTWKVTSGFPLEIDGVNNGTGIILISNLDANITNFNVNYGSTGGSNPTINVTVSLTVGSGTYGTGDCSLWCRLLYT